MVSQILKPECSFFTMRPEMVMNVCDPSPSGPIWAMLLLKRVAGTMMVGIGMTILVANVLIGFALLIGGWDFVLEFLAK